MTKLTKPALAIAPILPLLLVASASCAGKQVPMIEVAGARAVSACRQPLAPDGARAHERIAWTMPVAARDTLDDWCETAGPPVIDAQPESADGSDGSAPVDEIVLVSWNVHVGAGDVAELVRRLRAGRLTGGRPADRFVLLLQEAFRGDAVVPRLPAPTVAIPKMIRGRPAGRDRVDIVRLAQSLGLSLYYVPSMRNGAPADTDEDRGNAILSTEPLSDFAAVELPFERQRRVAVTASVSGRDSADTPWTLQLASAHLESTVPARRLWVFATAARTRQARALLGALGPDGALVLGGDFNTWFGFADPTYEAIAAVLPDVARADRRSTFAPFFRLDHVFSRDAAEWTVRAVRLEERFGSDHFPILARLRRTDP